jgi:hypothetical protein
MKNTADFLNLPLADVVAKTPGARVLHTIEVPGRKMYAVVVGAPEDEERAYLHCFGVRKSDDVITTRFDTPKLRNIQSTSLGTFPTLDPEYVAKWERNTLRSAACNRLARNFFRRVVKTPELLEGGLEYFGSLTETQFVWELTDEIYKRNNSNLLGKRRTFPEWVGTYRFDLDDQNRSLTRRLKYDPKTKLITARFTFFGGTNAAAHMTYGVIQESVVRPGDEPVSLTLCAAYPDGNWEKTQDFVERHAAQLRMFFEMFPVTQSRA